VCVFITAGPSTKLFPVVFRKDCHGRHGRVTLKMPPVPPLHGTTSWSFSTASSGQAAQESLHASLLLLREGSARDVSLSAATKSSSASEGAGGGGLSAAQEGEDLIYRLRSAVDKVCYRGEVGQKKRAFIRPRCAVPLFASLLLT
jgi:hypothetical protein